MSINFIVFGLWYLFLYKNASHSLSWPDRLVATFVLGMAQIILTEIFLGVVLKSLFPLPLFILNSVISLGLIFLGRVSPKTFGKSWEEIKERLERLFILWRKNKFLVFIFFLFLLQLGWVIFLGLLFPPYGLDSLSYHLPYVARIIQSGVIRDVPWFYPASLHQNLFPKNIELFFLWNMIFLKRDVLANLGQLPFILLGVISLYSIARKLNVERRYALFSPLFLFAPVVIHQASTSYVDAATSSLFIVSLNFLLKIGIGKSIFAGIILAGISTGLLLGAKLSGIMYLPLFIFFFFSLFLYRSHFVQKVKIKYLFAFFFLYLFFILLGGGFTYFKNLFLYHNPFYPLKISFLGHTLFKGFVNPKSIVPPPEVERSFPLLHSFLEHGKFRLSYSQDLVSGGFGPLFFILFLPAIFLSLFTELRKKNYPYLLLALVFILALFLTPANWWTRFIIFFFGFGVLSYILLLSRIKKVTVIYLSFPVIIYNIIVGNGHFFFTPLKIKKTIFLPLKVRTAAYFCPWRSEQADKEMFIWVSEKVKKDEVVVYSSLKNHLLSYPLWNREFSNRVIYIKPTNFKTWLEDLKKNKARFICVRTDSLVDRWYRNNKDYFNLEYDNGDFKVLSLRKVNS